MQKRNSTIPFAHGSLELSLEVGAEVDPIILDRAFGHSGHIGYLFIEEFNHDARPSDSEDPKSTTTSSSITFGTGDEYYTFSMAVTTTAKIKRERLTLLLTHSCSEIHSVIEIIVHKREVAHALDIISLLGFMAGDLEGYGENQVDDIIRSSGIVQK